MDSGLLSVLLSGAPPRGASDICSANSQVMRECVHFLKKKEIMNKDQLSECYYFNLNLSFLLDGILDNIFGTAKI